MTLIGVADKQGEYKGSNYHNVVLHCTEEDDSAVGMLTSAIKVKYDKCTEVFGRKLKIDDFIDFLGCSVSVNYNKYGVPQQVVFTDKDGTVAEVG